MPGEAERYAIRRFEKPSWWLLFGGIAVFWVCLLLAGLIRGYEPPVGWTIAVVTMPGWILPFVFLFWLGRLMNDQHVVVQADGLLFAVPFQSLVPYGDIDRVKRVSYAKPTGDYWLTTFTQRRLVPAWNAAPNIEIYFRRPVRLNYPFRWYRLLQLTLDKPNEFVLSLPPSVVEEGELVADVGQPASANPVLTRLILLICAVIIAVGFGYWIVFDG